MKKNNKKDSSAVVTVNNLPFSAKEEDLSDLFEECGEFTVDFDVTKDGLFKGSAKLNFETSKQARKALELDGVEFFDREISVEMSASGAAGTKDAAEPLSVCVKGLPADIKHEELDKLFKHCGRKIRVKVPREAGKSHGLAFIEFESQDSLRKALKVNGATLRESLKITVELGDPSKRSIGGSRREGRRARGRRF